MNALKLIRDIQQALMNAKNNGQSLIPIDLLDTYLKKIEEIATNDGANEAANQQVAQQTLTRDLEIWKTTATLNTTHQVEMFKSVIEAGLNALRSAIVINGGAAVALLAFLGSMIKAPNIPTDNPLISELSYALLIFLFGTGFAGTAAGVRYLAQFLYSRELDNNLSNKKCSFTSWFATAFNSLAILLGLASYGAFFFGGWTAYTAF